MKTKRTLLIAIAFLSVSILAQAQSASNEDRFELSVSQNKIILAPNSDAQLDISILKSKRYKHAKVELKVQNLPAGVSIEIEKNELIKSLYHLKFHANSNMNEGVYTIILYGSHYSKKRGVALTLKISNNGSTIIASN